MKYVLVLVFNGSYRELKQFGTEAERKAFTDGVLYLGNAATLDIWAVFWPEEATDLQKELPEAYNDAAKAVAEVAA